MLTVNDLMTVDPRTVSPTTKLTDVWRIMREEGFRQLPVIEDDVLVGIVTERDVRTVSHSAVFDLVSAEAVMTENPITVTPETPAFRAAEMLRSYKFGALPVVDDSRLVGIVTVSDFLGELSNAPQVSKPTQDGTSEVGIGIGDI